MKKTGSCSIRIKNGANRESFLSPTLAGAMIKKNLNVGKVSTCFKNEVLMLAVQVTVALVYYTVPTLLTLNSSN